MRKARTTLPIVISALVILGVLAVAGRAEKPSLPPGQPKPAPSSIRVGGAISGEGSPAEIRVTFVDSSFGYSEGSCFLSNPDYPPSLTVTGPGANMKQLRYYYCVNPDHPAGASMCGDPLNHGDDYYCLQIGGGTAQKKSDTGRVTFPIGSPWVISSKATMSRVAEGTLSVPVTYEVTAWTTPETAE